MDHVALGLRVKTGRAIVVVLAGPVKTPRVAARRELVLHDPSIPASLQPYHAGLEQAGEEAESTVRGLREIVCARSALAVQELIDELHGTGTDPSGAGIVVGSLVDPATIKNPHMHAHAAEGRLFFEALATGLERCGLAPAVHAEKDVYRNAADALRAKEGVLDRAVIAMGKVFGKPWRTEEKTAALAAWVALSRC